MLMHVFVLMVTMPYRQIKIQVCQSFWWPQGGTFRSDFHFSRQGIRDFIASHQNKCTRIKYNFLYTFLSTRTWIQYNYYSSLHKLKL